MSTLDDVKRYRWHDDGMWCFEPGEVRTTAQWVEAADYDALQAECEGLKKELGSVAYAGNAQFIKWEADKAELSALKQAIREAGPAIEGGAFCLEATALSHRHPQMIMGATKGDTNDAIRAGQVASNVKIELALQLRALVELVK